MVSLIFYGLIIAGAIGAVIRVGLHLFHDDYQITKEEIPIFAPVLIVLTILTGVIGYKVSVNNNVTSG